MPPSYKAVSGLGVAVNSEVTLQGSTGHTGTWLLKKGRKAWGNVLEEPHCISRAQQAGKDCEDLRPDSEGPAKTPAQLA